MLRLIFVIILITINQVDAGYEFNYSKITKVKTIKIGNTELQVPINAERVLKEKYGNNWSVPDKNWVYWKAPNAKYCNELGYRIVYNSTFAAPIN